MLCDIPTPPHTHPKKYFSAVSGILGGGGGNSLRSVLTFASIFYPLCFILRGCGGGGGGVNWNIPPQFLFTVAFIAYSKIYGYPPKKQTRGGATKINFAFEIKLNIFCSLGVKRQKIIIILTVLNDVSAPASVEASVRRV